MYNIVVTVALLLLAMISTLLGVASTEINEVIAIIYLYLVEFQGQSV